ncbi:thioesterase domain protein [Aspergillus undulatus]|uniref:thioesterase domain protein n=1 Tax=Aspergillus undulatus TaxID=1810928 RepID=UPI003CCCCB7F
MPPTSASFRLSDWGRQAATTTRKAINEKNLPNNSVILISWSMGGRMVVPFTIAAKELALDVIQYISFAATPGFSSIRPPQPGLAPANSGYFTVQARLENFCTQLLEMQKLNGNGDTEREIIPRDVYMREYVGATPINIIGLGLRYDDEKKGFVPDDVPHEHDSQVLNISNFPFITALYPTSILDASHALADRATWGFLLTYKLENMIGKHGLRNVQGKEDGDGTWKRLSDLVRSAPERLCLPVPGNHFFFVGEKSARDVAASVERVIGEAGDFQRELASLIESSA